MDNWIVEATDHYLALSEWAYAEIGDDLNEIEIDDLIRLVLARRGLSADYPVAA